jgi:hypothetical protein
MIRRLLLLFGLIFCALLSPRAHAATCTTLSSGASQTTIQNALTSCGSAGGGTVTFLLGRMDQFRPRSRSLAASQ